MLLKFLKTKRLNNKICCTTIFKFVSKFNKNFKTNEKDRPPNLKDNIR